MSMKNILFPVFTMSALFGSSIAVAETSSMAFGIGKVQVVILEPDKAAVVGGGSAVGSTVIGMLGRQKGAALGAAYGARLGVAAGPAGLLVGGATGVMVGAVVGSGVGYAGLIMTKALYNAMKKR